MKKLLKFFNGYHKECVLGPLFKLLEASFELLIPILVQQIIDYGIPNNDSSYVIRRVLLMGLLCVVGMLCSLTAQYFSAKAAVGFSASLKSSVFSHVHSLSYTELDSIGISTLITRLSSDVNTLQGGVNMSLRLLLRSPFIVLGAVIMAFRIDLRAAGIFVVTVALLSAVVVLIMRFTIPMQKQVQERLDTLTSHSRANIGGVRVVRAFRLEDAQQRDFETANKALLSLQLAAGRISACLNPITFLIVNIGLIALLWDGHAAVLGGRLSTGEVVALVNYMSQILVELIKLANLIVQLSRALACAGRIADVLTTGSSMQEGTQDIPGGAAASLCFNDVSFHYKDAAADALSSVSFKLPCGSTLGVIGGTGAGKSSLAALIPRFYDVNSGSVLVDGLDVREYSYASLRRRIAMVPQRSVLFAGSLRDNMRFGKADATDSEIIEALKCAQAYDFVMEKEGGLDYMVSQGGSNFSGGQRQRLAIARALVRKPSLLILDDSASALDYSTDAALRKAIREMPDAPTTIIISQRAASIMHAQQILVLDAGRMAGLGSHEELLDSCDIYREIYESQFGGAGNAK